MITLLVSLAGGVGAASRFVLDGVITHRTPKAPFPLGTVAINVVGSLVLGVVVGVTLREQSGIPPEVARILGVGFCGGFTTFSTSALEAVKLWAEDGPDRAAAYTLVTVLASVAAAALGLAFTAG